MPSPYQQELYATEPETPVYEKETGTRKVNKILMGTWAGIVEDPGGDRVRVVTAGKNGWVERAHLRDRLGLKLFFVDVGQGDAVLGEVDGKRFLVDGGPNSNLFRYLTGYQFKYLITKNKPVHLDEVFVSHFDADHYVGLTKVINDDRYTFGAIYHNGIARFHSSPNKRPAGYSTDLGVVKDDVLKTTFNHLQDARDLLDEGGLQTSFRKFLEAVVAASDQGRLKTLKRLTARTPTVPGYSESQDLTIRVLGPVPRKASGRIDWPWLHSSSHTRNGHSLVLKFEYGEQDGQSTSFLLGGDLNSDAEQYLMDHYGAQNPFQVDVAKSCHHGSGDFLTKFMKRLNPKATVISSGDNESYAHPRADAIGCAGRYSRGARPKVFSTELARSISSGGDILYGMINCRTDGDRIVMAQMKERRTSADIWDSYTI